MSLSKIQDGQPLTYDFINKMVAEINKLSKASNKVADGSGLDEVDFFFGNTKNVKGKVVAGNVLIKKADGDEALEFVKFPVTFGSAPMVVVTVDQNISKKKTPIKAAAMVSSVDKTGFWCRVMLIDDSTTFAKSVKEVNINYIAVGSA